MCKCTEIQKCVGEYGCTLQDYHKFNQSYADEYCSKYLLKHFHLLGIFGFSILIFPPNVAIEKLCRVQLAPEKFPPRYTTLLEQKCDLKELNILKVNHPW